ncbi:MAG: KH domain-containing protein [Candidatus Altiarchaeota archaeon]|nr:KH domain-containing protein [Candidatus Altiarchaeota archaeon]
MVLPICELCAQTGLLCAACERKLGEGKISEFDVELSRMLYVVLGAEASFMKIVETSDNLVVLTERENVGKIIGKGGSTIKDISLKLGKQIRVVGVGDFKDMVYDFIAPAKVNGFNRVFVPDGSVKYRVRIDRRDEKKLRIPLRDLERMIDSVTGAKVDLILE